MQLIASSCARAPVAWRVAPRMGLSVKTAPLPKSQLSLEISVGMEECTAAWDSVVGELSKRATIRGFRKGGAPKQMVINEYGKDTIRASACEEVIEKAIQKALKESGVNAIGQADIDSEGGVDAVIAAYDPKAPLSFKVKIDVWPEAEFTASYEGLEIEAEEPPFEDNLIDEALEELQKKESFSVLSPEGTKAEIGKLVVGDLVGYYRNEDASKGDKLPDIAEGEAIEISMTEGQYMPGFVEGLVGAAVGETRSVNVQFPESNPRPELAGVKAIFEVSVHAVKDVMLPELDDKFAQQVSEAPTLAELRDTIRARLNVENESLKSSNVNTAIDSALADIVNVDLPESLVENQVKNKFAKMLGSFKDKGMSDSQVKAMVTKENYELYKTRSRATVERSLLVNFAISKIAKDKGIVVDPQEIEDQMALVRGELKGQEMEEEKIRDQVEAQLERDLVLAVLKESAKITMVPPKEEEE